MYNVSGRVLRRLQQFFFGRGSLGVLIFWESLCTCLARRSVFNHRQRFNIPVGFFSLTHVCEFALCWACSFVAMADEVLEFLYQDFRVAA